MTDVGTDVMHRARKMFSRMTGGIFCIESSLFDFEAKSILVHLFVVSSLWRVLLL